MWVFGYCGGGGTVVAKDYHLCFVRAKTGSLIVQVRTGKRSEWGEGVDGRVVFTCNTDVGVELPDIEEGSGFSLDVLGALGELAPLKAEEVCFELEGELQVSGDVEATFPSKEVWEAFEEWRLMKKQDEEWRLMKKQDEELARLDGGTVG